MQAPGKGNVERTGAPNAPAGTAMAPFLRFDELRSLTAPDSDRPAAEGLPEVTVLALWAMEGAVRDVAARETSRRRGILLPLLGWLLLFPCLPAKLASLRSKRRALTAAYASLESARDRATEIAGFQKAKPDPASRSYLLAFIRGHAERVCLSLAATPWSNPWAKLCAEEERVRLVTLWVTLERDHVRRRNGELRRSLTQKDDKR